MAELSLYRINTDKASKTGDTFSGQITSIVSDKAPIVLDPGAAAYVVANLNADKLDGFDSATTATINTVAVRDASANLTSNIFISTVVGTISTGSAPLTVASSKRVINLNADLLDDMGSSTTATASTIAARDSSANLTSNILISTVAGTTTTGSAPLTVASSKKVVNLNSDLLDDMNSATAATASTIAARDSSANLTANVLISNVAGTLTTGTPPLTVTSTKKVANLNADLLDDLDASAFPLKINTSTANLSIYEQVAAFTNDTASQTGTLKITLPKTWSSTMLNITIKGYDFSTNGAYELILGGYNYLTSSQWQMCTAWANGPCPFTSVRFGHDGTKCCILLGTTATVWQYPKIYIEKVIAGTSGQTGWDTGWAMALITSETGITISTQGVPTMQFLPAAQLADNTKFLRNDNTWASVTPANIGAAATSHGNHVPTTQVANNTTFLRNDNTWYQVTLTDIGAAPINHGNHVPAVQAADNKVFLRNDNSWQTVTPANIGAAPSGYGLGTTAFRLSAGTDLNTVVVNGWYDVSSPVNGVPLAVSGVAMTFHSIFVNATADVNFVTQLAFPMSDGVQNTGFIRQKRAGTWGAWVPISTIIGASTAGFFDNTTTAPTSTWTNRLNWGGVFYASKVYNAVFNDYAEYFLKDDNALSAGDIVAKNPSGNGYIKSRYAYDKLVVGVYSDDYGQCLGGNGDGHDEENFASVGMAGRVRAKVIGNISEGDLLVASNIPGVAMTCAQYTPGTVIGKALETHSGDTIDRIQILIMNM